MQACHRPRCCRVPLLSEVVVIFHRGTGRTVPAESRCVLTLPSPCRSTFRSHPEVIPTRPLPLEAVTRVTQASRCLNTRCVGNATLPQKTRHVSQALTDTCVHWEQKPCVFGLKLAWNILGEWREKGRKVHLSSRGDGSCLTSVGLGSPSLQALERHLLRVSLAGWLMNLNRLHWAQRWANGRGRPSVLNGLGTPEILRPSDRWPSQPA